jgi:hypothetical protein
VLHRKNIQRPIPGQLRHAAGAAAAASPSPCTPVYHPTSLLPAVLLSARAAHTPLHRLRRPPAPLLCRRRTSAHARCQLRGGWRRQRRQGAGQGAARAQCSLEQVTCGVLLVTRDVSHPPLSPGWTTTRTWSRRSKSRCAPATPSTPPDPSSSRRRSSPPPSQPQPPLPPPPRRLPPTFLQAFLGIKSRAAVAATSSQREDGAGDRRGRKGAALSGVRVSACVNANGVVVAFARSCAVVVRR